MDLWNAAMVALVIVSVIAFSLWARIRANSDKSEKRAKSGCRVPQ
jgi:membrane protein implicated in regulation of membrane protease activity